MHLKPILALATSLFLAASPVFAVPVNLTILHTNDTHDRLKPFDTAEQNDLAGIARRATLISELKQKSPNTLVLDAGDTFQGTPLFNFFSGAADYEAFDQAGYDATTVGNHDLDLGLPNLVKQAQGRKFALISSNLLDPATRKPIFMPFKFFERRGLKVAVFGVIGDQAYNAVAAVRRAGTTIVSPPAMTQKLVDELRPQADLVVMLSHCGLNEDLDLAKKVKGIDVIVGGHSHTLVPRPIEVMNDTWRTLVVQDYMWGEYLGKLDLTVDDRKVTAFNGELIQVKSSIKPDPRVAATVAHYDQQIAKAMAKVIGQSPTGLSTALKRERDCELGNWVTDVVKARTGVEIGAINQGAMRAPLLPGPITLERVYSIFPFDEGLVIGQVSGQLLKEILDHAARTPGRSGMMQYSGVTFGVVDGKVRDPRVNGEPLDLNRTYSIATIEYVADGNDRYELFLQVKDYRPVGINIRDAVIEEIETNSVVKNAPIGRIKLLEPALVKP